MEYTKDDLLVLGKRYNNAKRSYLLIDPLQAKHIPVSPSAALKMMRSLGKKLYEKTGGADCIIGFAETATAIAAAAASEFDDDPFFIHTTREYFEGEELLYFSEEHSHASEQFIYRRFLEKGDFHSVILIDDEFSTGKTLMNIISVLKKLPSMSNAVFTAGSVINRISPENLAKFHDGGTDFISLCEIDEDDFEERVRGMDISAPIENYTRIEKKYEVFVPDRFDEWTPYDIRLGNDTGDLFRHINEFVKKAGEYLAGKISPDERILVMGTEEFMCPALVLGEWLEDEGFNVLSHSTTRSPIGISSDEDYPIRSGYKIHSFYDTERNTFIYNTASYDKIIVVTDSRNDEAVDLAMRDITSVFEADAFYLVRYI